MTQKKPSRGVLRKRCSENMQPVYSRTPMPKMISIKFQSNSIGIALRHRCSPVNLLHIFRTPFPTNTSLFLMTVSQYLGIIQIWRNLNEHHYWMSNTIINFNEIRDLSRRRELFSIPDSEYASYLHQTRTLKTELLQSNIIFF